MADLIDRDKLIDHIMELYPDWCVKPVRPIFDFISGMPSAERHGHWIKTRMPVTGAIEIKCSECDQKYYTAFQLMWNYCPSCGARMDGEQDG